MKLNIQNIKTSFFNELAAIYDKREVKRLFEIVCEAIFDLSRTDLLLHDSIETTRDNALTFNQTLTELKAKKPIQYILGTAPFYGRDFKVNEHTLIPRQETEELIQLILNQVGNTEKNILDIGTGTGIIPITLGLESNFNSIYAIDASEQALAIAKQNASQHKVEVNFLQVDILEEQQWEMIPNTLDVIVSNPPYVMNKEKALMNHNVLDYEPHLALFVADDNPLVFYHSIAKLATQKLKTGRMLFFEINEQLGQETKAVLEQNGFIKVEIVQDINGKDRFVFGVKS